METIIIIFLLVIAAEATYLVSLQQKKTINKKSGRPIFVDTSVLIDGRIIAVAMSGFISDTLFIPRSVIGELQFLADHADTEKRGRARHGLDVVSELQAMPGVKVEIFQDGSKAEEGVDERLLKLAKQYNGAVCTIDYNLNKVAQVEDITVLNVNDLAMSLRMAYLPGEKILLELTQKGQDGHQAVGHLTDGTMVVVERANKLIGKSVEIEFIRSLQTAAGKMMFAKLVEPKKTDSRPLEIVKQRPAKNPKRTFSVEKEAPIVLPVEIPVVPTAYHSDRNDQRLVQKQGKNTNRKQRVDDTSNDRPARSFVVSRPDQTIKKATKRPRSSAQNEDDLIKLLNNQG